MDLDEVATPLQTQVEMAVLMTMLANFSLIGTIGNGLVIFVFQRVREKSTAQIFMIFLAIIDLFTCTVIIPLTMFMEYTRFNIEYNSLCKMYHFIITSKIPLSAFIMVAIAVDRYFCICHPLKKAITIARARLIIVGFVLVAFTFGLITTFFYSVMGRFQRIEINRVFEIIGHNMTQIILNITDKQQQTEQLKKKVAEEVARRNLTVDWDVNSSLPRKEEIFNMGRCDFTYDTLSRDTLFTYRTLYNAIFPSCLVIVISLYLMIYRFMCLRRSKKLKQRLKMCSYVNQNGGGSTGTNGLAARDDDNGFVTELSAVSQSPPLNQSKKLNIDNKKNTEDESATRLLKETCLNEPPNKQFLSPPTTRLFKHGLSSSFSNLPSSDAKSVTECTMSPSSSYSYMTGAVSENNLSVSPSPTASTVAISESDRKNGHNNQPRHQQHNNKLRLYKKQESIKRYKNKKRALLNKKQRNSNQSRDYDPDRLREENRKANVKTALMLFTVNIVFVIAFGPAWLITLGLIPHYRLVFYMYFIYNAANPFIYAFMNHIFKAYMRNIFTCKQKAMVVVSS